MSTRVCGERIPAGDEDVMATMSAPHKPPGREGVVRSPSWINRGISVPPAAPPLFPSTPVAIPVPCVCVCVCVFPVTTDRRGGKKKGSVKTQKEGVYEKTYTETARILSIPFDLSPYRTGSSRSKFTDVHNTKTYSSPPLFLVEHGNF